RFVCILYNHHHQLVSTNLSVGFSPQNKMPSCLVNQCVNKSGRKGQSEGVILHKFPNDTEKIKLWLLQSGQRFLDIDAMAEKIYQARKLNKYALCSSHFTTDCYTVTPNGRVLKPHAIPRLFPCVVEGESIIEETLKKDRHRSRKKRPLELTPLVEPYPGAALAFIKTEVETDFMSGTQCNVGTQTEFNLSNSEVVYRLIL
ncbi:hypothetical protein GDO81_023177, partial [Engystomops pustulosus]